MSSPSGLSIQRIYAVEQDLVLFEIAKDGDVFADVSVDADGNATLTIFSRTSSVEMSPSHLLETLVRIEELRREEP